MSRQGARTPEFRLRFGYPFIEIERVGEPPRRVSLEADPGPALRDFAAEVTRAGGRLTAALPEAEVWRGRVAASDGGEVARRAGAVALGAAPRDMRIALGPVRADGLRAAAAARRDTLRDARSFLAQSGLKPRRLSGAGAFPGFDAPPTFAPFTLPDARAACGFAAALSLMAWLAPWSADAPQAPTLLAAAPVAVAPGLPAPVVLTEIASVAPPVVKPDLALAALTPRARPAGFAPVEVEPAQAVVRPELVPISLAARNAPSGVTIPSPVLEAIGQPLPRPTPKASPAKQAQRPADPRGPLPRPASLGAATVAAPKQTASLRAPDAPKPRPASLQSDVRVASLGSEVIATDAKSALPQPHVAPETGPMSRPAEMARTAAPEPIRVASLAPAAGLAVATVLAPEPRRIAPTPVTKTSAPSKPRSVSAPAAARPQPVAIAPAKIVRTQPVRVQAAAQPKPVAKTQTVRLKPQPAAAPVRTAALAPAPVRIAPKAQPVRVQRIAAPVAPKAQPTRVQRVAAQPARTQSGQAAVRGNAVFLVGIFGGAGGRHALIQLPNGDTERVRAGDEVQGVQVTAIAADGVRLTSRGRETVLRLPD